MTSVCFGYRLYAIVDIFWEILNEQQREEEEEKKNNQRRDQQLIYLSVYC